MGIPRRFVDSCSVQASCHLGQLEMQVLHRERSEVWLKALDSAKMAQASSQDDFNLLRLGLKYCAQHGGYVYIYMCIYIYIQGLGYIQMCYIYIYIYVGSRIKSTPNRDPCHHDIKQTPM